MSAMFRCASSCLNNMQPLTIVIIVIVIIITIIMLRDISKGYIWKLETHTLSSYGVTLCCHIGILAWLCCFCFILASLPIDIIISVDQIASKVYNIYA